MKRKFLLMPLVAMLLSGCVVSINKNGITYAGQGQAGHLDTGLIILIVFLTLFILGAASLVIILVTVNRVKKQRRLLKQKLDSGEITQEEYEAELAKTKIGNKK